MVHKFLNLITALPGRYEEIDETLHLKRKPNEERVKGRGGYIKTNTKMNNVQGWRIDFRGKET